MLVEYIKTVEEGGRNLGVRSRFGLLALAFNPLQ